MLKLPYQTNYYQGKVRDVYTIADKYLIMVVSDRISAFDVVLPRLVPYKGQVLNQLALRALVATADIMPNWMIASPLPHVTIGLRCNPYPIEMVVRATLTGHAWRVYASGGRMLCGVTMPDGMKENEHFAQPIITPSTKAHEGHDEDISREEIIKRGLVSEEEYARIETYALALFKRGQEIADSRGLILADTKYEFGRREGQIYLIDELHTPDSSRYFYKEGYEARLAAGEAQRQLSKEFVREWLMSEGFQGKEGQKVPTMTDAIVDGISKRYIELYEQITGAQFVPENVEEEEILSVLTKAIGELPDL